MNNNIFYNDLHIHTNRSFCSPREVVPETYAPFCEEEGIKIIGISNHVYPTDMIEANGYPGETSLSRLASLKDELVEAEKKTGIKYLFGCELDNFEAAGGPFIKPEESGIFDYMLFPASHILNWPHMFSDYDLNDPNVIRKLTIDRFIAACKLDYPVPVGICHPLYPICSNDQKEIVDGISDSCMKELFSMAKERDYSIEIHACLYRNGTPLNEEGLSETYLRVLAAAKDCGCKFHFGSDAHAPGAFKGVHGKLRRAAEILGITPDDIWEITKT